MKIANIYKYTWIALGIVFCIPLFSEGAVLHLEPTVSTARVGDTILVNIYIDTEGELINAIEGTLSYTGPIEFATFTTGKSFIQLWMDPVDRFTKNSAGVPSLYFSGIKPHGRVSEEAMVFSVRFKAVGTGSAYVKLDDVRMVTNELYEQVYTVDTITKSIYINAEATQAEEVITEPLGPADIEPPIPFRPVITTGMGVGDGGYNAIFVTQDFGSGMSHYRIFESEVALTPSVIEDTKHNWPIAESPYKLSDKAPEHFIYIMAYDRAGNERLGVIEPRVFVTPEELDLTVFYELILVFLVILLLILLLLLRSLVMRRRGAYVPHVLKHNIGPHCMYPWAIVDGDKNTDEVMTAIERTKSKAGKGKSSKFVKDRKLTTQSGQVRPSPQQTGQVRPSPRPSPIIDLMDRGHIKKMKKHTGARGHKNSDGIRDPRFVGPVSIFYWHNK